MGNLALYYAKKGNAAEAANFIRRARSIEPSNVELIYDEALVYALAGHRDEALKVLRQAFQKGYPAEDAKNDPELNSLQSRPEFAKLVADFSRKSR
jgi:Flp pilus assembly protein TadD